MEGQTCNVASCYNGLKVYGLQVFLVTPIKLLVALKYEIIHHASMILGLSFVRNVIENFESVMKKTVSEIK